MRPLLQRIFGRLVKRFFGLAVLLLLLYLAYAAYAMFSREKSYLKQTAKGFLREVAAGGAVAGGAADPAVAAALERDLAFLDGKGVLGVAIFRDGEPTPYWQKNLDLSLLRAYRSRDLEDDSSLFLVSIHDASTAWHDRWSTWNLVYRYHQNGWCVLVSSPAHFELGERLVEGLAAALVATVLFSVVGGVLYNRRYLRPVNAMAETMRQAESGQLAARIDTTGFTDELLVVGRALNQMLGTLEESFRKVSDFSAGAAHELRTPLAALRGGIEVCLARERGGDEYRETLGQTLEETVRLAQIVEKLLLLSRPGRLTDTQLESVDLRQVVEGQLEKLQLLADERRLRFERQWATPPAVRGDHALLGQLVFNLLHNAAKHSPPGGTIRLGLAVHGDWLTLTVADHGPGIPPACRERIFQPFYQCDPSRGTGVGLGLALVRWIALAHGGAVACDAAPSGGACFRLNLPLERITA